MFKELNWKEKKIIAFQQCKDMGEVAILIDKIYNDGFSDGVDHVELRIIDEFGDIPDNLDLKMSYSDIVDLEDPVSGVINGEGIIDHPVTGKVTPEEAEELLHEALIKRDTNE